MPHLGSTVEKTRQAENAVPQSSGEHTTTGPVIATFTDKYGETRKVIKRRGNGRRKVSVANRNDSLCLTMNREVAAMFGAAVREHRIRRGWTLEELAVRSGIVSGYPKDRMWNIEHAFRGEGVRLGTLYAIAAALNVEVSALLPGVADVLEKASVDKVRKPMMDVLLSSRGRVEQVL